MNAKHYRTLLIMAVLSFLSMYLLMYAMIDSFDGLYLNLNQAYMAGLMAAPMIIFEIFLMSAMYPNKKANAFILAGSVAALAIFFLLIRQQTAITDTQFLRSMIPHHAGAILMCGKANIQDKDIKDLCKKIIAGQSSEIAQMKAKLDELQH